MEPMAVKLSRAYVTITSQLKEPMAAKPCLLVSNKTNLTEETVAKPLPLAHIIHTVMSELMEPLSVELNCAYVTHYVKVHGARGSQVKLCLRPTLRQSSRSQRQSSYHVPPYLITSELKEPEAIKLSCAKSHITSVLEGRGSQAILCFFTHYVRVDGARGSQAILYVTHYARVDGANSSQSILYLPKSHITSEFMEPELVKLSCATSLITSELMEPEAAKLSCATSHIKPESMEPEAVKISCATSLITS
jgi:hypothetical protein